MARIYQPLEIKKDGKGIGLFHMCVGSDEERWTHAVGYCAKDCPGHATKEEAIRHYYDYLADNMRVGTSSSAHKCRVCQEWTPKYCTHADACTMIFLCDKHWSQDEFREQLNAMAASGG